MTTPPREGIPEYPQYNLTGTGHMSPSERGLIAAATCYDQRDWWRDRAVDGLSLLANVHHHGTAEWNDRVGAIRKAIEGAIK